MGGKGLLVWLAGGVGVFLLYSAVSDQTPLSLIKSYLGSGSPEKFPVAAASSGGGGPFDPTQPGGLLPPGILPPVKVAPPGQTPDTSPKQQYTPQGNPLAGYGGGGVYDLIDANGNNLGAIPAAYQNNPNAYVPPPGGHIQNA